VKPIPLSSPDGTVYAYACSVCHQVASDVGVVRRAATGPIPVLVEMSLKRAGHCCTCIGCGASLGNEEREAWGVSCGDCSRDWAARRMWLSIACCAQHGFSTQAEFDAYASRGEDL
jgi:hypothetical protein